MWCETAPVSRRRPTGGGWSCRSCPRPATSAAIAPDAKGPPAEAPARTIRGHLNRCRIAGDRSSVRFAMQESRRICASRLAAMAQRAYGFSPHRRHHRSGCGHLPDHRRSDMADCGGKFHLSHQCLHAQRGGMAPATPRRMLPIGAVFAFVGRQLGRILSLAFSWATMALFGRVPEDRQIFLSLMAAASLLWRHAATCRADR